MQPPIVFFDTRHDDHRPPAGMPETPGRLEACLEGLEASGAVFELQHPQPAAGEDLARAHDPDYLDRLAEYCASGGGWIDADTFVGPGSFDAAVRAAGACCAAADAAMQHGRRSFCLVRPPGHHATRDRAMGFCLINGAAVAAGRTLSAGAAKVAIVDFDVHHGNGTQEIFWTDPAVLYVSIHQWPWYPWSSGELGETGAGEGRGCNVNIPLPEGCGDELYLQALRRIAMPAVRRFGPEMLIVSAGFDAHRDDPLGGQLVSSEGFAAICRLLVATAVEVCGGKVVFCLEGGYNLQALRQAAPAVVGALSGPEAVSDGPGEWPGWLEDIARFHHQT